MIKLQSYVVTPISYLTNFLENIDEQIFSNLCVDDDNGDSYDNGDSRSVLSESATTPLYYRRDWSTYLEDLNVSKKNGGRPMSTELYTILQMTISTIDPYEYEDFSDDDASCTSLPVHVTSDVFNKTLNLKDNVECKNKPHPRRTEHTKRRKLN